MRLDPVGTAGHYAGFLLVEQPLPWPADASEVPELVPVARMAAAARLRLQLLCPPPNNQEAAGADEVRRLICYREARDGWAGELRRSEVVAASEDLRAAAEELVVGTSPAGAPSPGAPSPGAPSPGAASAPLTEVLVCTHGRRDGCCGSLGSRLFGELVEGPLTAPSGVLRLWRTSHTGGHRFAPTSLVFPSGTLWAYADRALLQSILDAEGPVAEALPHYRGCATLGSPAQQALERAVLAEVGWGLLATPRRAVDMRGSLVRLEAEGYGEWVASVQEGRRVPQPDCRTPPELATKQGVEWEVDGLRQLA